MKKLIDDKGRLFGKISVIDVFVALVVIALAVAVFAKFKLKDNPFTTSNTVNVTYTIKINGIRMSNAKLMQPGDKLYTQDVGNYLGTITDVKIEDAYAVEPIIDGTYAKGRVYERYDVTLTLETLCSHSNGRYYADRMFELSVNSELWVCTKYNEMIGTLMTLSAN